MFRVRRRSPWCCRRRSFDIGWPGGAGRGVVRLELKMRKRLQWVEKLNDPPSQAIRAMKKMSDLMIRRRSLRATASEDWGGSWTGLSGYHIYPGWHYIDTIRRYWAILTISNYSRSSSSLPGDLGASGSSTSLNSQESPPPCQMRCLIVLHRHFSSHRWKKEWVIFQDVKFVHLNFGNQEHTSYWGSSYDLTRGEVTTFGSLCYHGNFVNSFWLLKSFKLFKTFKKGF